MSIVIGTLNGSFVFTAEPDISIQVSGMQPDLVIGSIENMSDTVTKRIRANYVDEGYPTISSLKKDIQMLEKRLTALEFEFMQKFGRLGG